MSGMAPVLSTVAGPALYAARASLRSPLYLSSNWRRKVAPASMFCCGIEDVSHLELLDGGGHQLHQALGAFRGDCAGVEGRFLFDYAANQLGFHLMLLCGAVDQRGELDVGDGRAIQFGGIVRFRAGERHSTAISLCLRTDSRWMAMAARCFCHGGLEGFGRFGGAGGEGWLAREFAADGGGGEQDPEEKLHIGLIGRNGGAALVSRRIKAPGRSTGRRPGAGGRSASIRGR